MRELIALSSLDSSSKNWPQRGVQGMLEGLPRLSNDLAPDLWGAEHCALARIDSFSTTDSSIDFSNEFVRVVLVGDLYNRQELSSSLDCRIDESAARIAGLAYQRWGCDGVARLFGDFCFSLWDSRTQKLLLARDYLGWRPIYYHWDKSRLVAASSLQVMRALPEFLPELNKGFLAEYVLHSYGTVDQTILKGVHRLLPGSYLVLDRDGICLTQYWDPCAVPKLQYANDRQYAEHLRSLLGDAVADRRSGQTSVAVSLSGGVDSTAVSAVLARTTRVNAFSIEFPGRSCDERSYVEDFAQLQQLKVEYLQPQLDSLFGIQSQISRFGNIPSEPNGVFGMQIRAAAVRAGNRLLFTGFGGDELFTGGEYRYLELIRTGRLTTLFRQLLSDPRPRDLLTDRVPRTLKHSLQKQFESLRWLPDWITPQFRDESDIDQRLRNGWKVPDGLSLQHRTMYSQLYNGLALNLREMEYRNTLASDLVVRHPLYDHRIMQFCFAIPEEQLCKNQLHKYVLRNAVDDLLPKCILHRREKADFSFVNWELLTCLGEKHTFLDLPILQIGWFDRSVLEQLYDELLLTRAKDPSAYLPSTEVFWHLYWANQLVAEFG